MAVVYPFPQALFHASYTGASTLNVVVSTNQTDFDLWNYISTNYANPSSYGIFNVTINSGVIIDGSSSGTPSFTTGAGWPGGSSLTITNNGTIGGPGGYGGYYGGPGEAGTNAMIFTLNASLTNAVGGEIAGGGGGGGTGFYNMSYYYNSTDYSGWADGGGGAGRSAGAAGDSSGAASYPTAGSHTDATGGTATLGGDGGYQYFVPLSQGYYGGDGGDRGAAGAEGDEAAGGAAGKAVEKNGFTVNITNNGNIYGATS